MKFKCREKYAKMTRALARLELIYTSRSTFSGAIHSRPGSCWRADCGPVYVIWGAQGTPTISAVTTRGRISDWAIQR
jgi:hypothetical protein